MFWISFNRQKWVKAESCQQKINLISYSTVVRGCNIYTNFICGIHTLDKLVSLATKVDGECWHMQPEHEFEFGISLGIFTSLPNRRYHLHFVCSLVLFTCYCVYILCGLSRQLLFVLVLVTIWGFWPIMCCMKSPMLGCTLCFWNYDWSNLQ